MKKQELSMLNYFAVLIVFLFSGAGTLMNAALQTMIEAWPQLSATTVRMVVSMPPLVSLPVMLLVGVVVGKKLSFRFCAIFGTLLVAVGGVAPYFFYKSWFMIMVFRALLGVGVGFLGMRNTLVVKSIPVEKQAAYIGYGTVLMNVGSVIANPIVGFLTQYSWRHAFLFDAIAFIPVIIMLIGLKEPVEEGAAEETSTGEAAAAETGKIGWRVYYYMVMQLLTTAVLYPLLSGMATFMADKGLGTAAIAGTILSCYTFAGAAVNMVISPVMKICGKKSIAAMCVLVVAGTAICLFVPAVPAMVVGVILAGIGFNAMISIFQVYNGAAAPASKVGFCSSVILAMLQFGIFLSTYFIVGCHAIFQRSTDIESAWMGCMIIYAVMAAFAFVVKVAPED